MLRETLKKEIDQLSESQLRTIADFVALIKKQQGLTQNVPFWQGATPMERAEDFRGWVAQLSQTGLSLPDQAFERGNIYDG
ncbi:hypothetical protein VB712_07835 [Spirulina sp. CCNP1310]|uniref:hypothetical protein n=1 Tax=Spirulina sp. CCNP1310 TaxID=3110249 RepID=UPI002B2008A5|nr:hypothetical protein [Spirulina sp. CCNP1310]MEA5419137.1 hypothetical protein [Spirulina sp. CCNP1310]